MIHICAYEYGILNVHVNIESIETLLKPVKQSTNGNQSAKSGSTVIIIYETLEAFYQWSLFIVLVLLCCLSKLGHLSLFLYVNGERGLYFYWYVYLALLFLPLSLSKFSLNFFSCAQSVIISW